MLQRTIKERFNFSQTLNSFKSLNETKDSKAAVGKTLCPPDPHERLLQQKLAAIPAFLNQLTTPLGVCECVCICVSAKNAYVWENYLIQTHTT